MIAKDRDRERDYKERSASSEPRDSVSFRELAKSLLLFIQSHAKWRSFPRNAAATDATHRQAFGTREPLLPEDRVHVMASLRAPELAN